MKTLLNRIGILSVLAISVSLLPPLQAAKDENQEPQKPADLWQESIEAETSGDYDKALELIYAYRKADGDEYCAAVRAGWLSWLKKDYDKALDFYQSANQTMPTAVAPLQGIANVFWVKGNYKNAERAINALLKNSPGDYTALMTRGRLRYEQYDYRSALLDFTEAHRRYPTDTASASWAGWSAYYKADFRQAKKLFEKVLALDANYPLAEDGLQLAQR